MKIQLILLSLAFVLYPVAVKAEDGVKEGLQNLTEGISDAMGNTTAQDVADGIGDALGLNDTDKEKLEGFVECASVLWNVAIDPCHKADNCTCGEEVQGDFDTLSNLLNSTDATCAAVDESVCALIDKTDSCCLPCESQFAKILECTKEDPSSFLVENDCKAADACIEKGIESAAFCPSHFLVVAGITAMWTVVISWWI